MDRRLVYFRKGSEFEEVSLPYSDFPACEEKPSEKDSGDKYLKTIEATTRPEKWLPSGDLVLGQHSESEMETGRTGIVARQSQLRLTRITRHQ